MALFSIIVYKQLFARSSYRQIEYRERYIRLLNIFLSGETYTKSLDVVNFDNSGHIGRFAKEYLENECITRRFKPTTICNYTSALNRFITQLNIEKVDITNLSENDIIDYIQSVNHKWHSNITPIKNFLRYMYDQSVISEDLSKVVRQFKTKNRVILPSYYSKEEIMCLEQSISRSDPSGKRDFAIVVLATRIGLRASDIVKLKFTDIDWDRNIICLTQTKTSQPIHLPLLTVIGDAIIDYIKNGRPKSNCKNIFLTHLSGVHRPLCAGSLSSIVSNRFKMAGINTRGRHHGSHSLRHSLATALLNQNTQLPIISEVLGHDSTASTMCYLGIDVQSLLECSLDVPIVNDSFYTQKGGYFYEK